jgi:hypothetical protein
LSDFQFLGTVFSSDTYRHSKKSTVKGNSTVVKTFKWLLNVINGKFSESKFDLIEFWHEGSCGRCGRKLTVPSSIKTGMGPSCSKIIKLIK